MMQTARIFLSTLSRLRLPLIASGVVAAIFCLSFSSSFTSKNPESIPSMKPSKAMPVRAQRMSLPLTFEKNEGQAEESIRFRASGKGLAFSFKDEGVLLSLPKKGDKAAELKISFIDADPRTRVEGLDETKHKSHYYYGKEPSSWHTNIPNYAKVCYQSVYSNIDAVFYGNKNQLEYDFAVLPGGNPLDARLRINGARSLSIDSEGNLQIEVDDKENVQMLKPIVYQTIEGNRTDVEGAFVLLAQNDIGFKVGSYDPAYPLIIDPTIAYSTFIGSEGDVVTFSNAVDPSGKLYFTGSIGDKYGDFLISRTDILIGILSADGSELLDTAVFGNDTHTGEHTGQSIAIDTMGNAYVTGFTTGGLPTTSDAFQKDYQGGSHDAFVLKVDSNLDIIYCTYLGGNGDDLGTGIAVDDLGCAYVTGWVFPPDPATGSPSTFPVKYPVGSLLPQPKNFLINAFVTKFNASGTALEYSVLIGEPEVYRPDADTLGNAINVDSERNAYVAGQTSANLPTTENAYSSSLQGGGDGGDGFIAVINPDATDFTYLTYIGGSSLDTIYCLGLDSDLDIYVGGYTRSKDFPITKKTAYQTTLGGGEGDAFFAKLSPRLTETKLVYSTYLGGSLEDSAFGLAVGPDGNAYLVGETRSWKGKDTDGVTQTAFPVTGSAEQLTNTDDTTKAFFSRIDPTASGVNSLVYSTYLGGGQGSFTSASGVSVDISGNGYICGGTNASDYPTTEGAEQTTFGDAQFDGFVTKFDFNAESTVFKPSNAQGKQQISSGTGARRQKTDVGDLQELLPLRAKFNINSTLRKKNSKNRMTDVLTWKTPSSGMPPVSYRVFKDRNLTHFIGSVEASQKLKFKIPDRKLGKRYTYYIISVGERGDVSKPAKVVVGKNR